MEPANFQERCIGLDVLSRSTMKLFVHDVLCLQPIDCLSHKEHSLHSHNGHIINRIEVMGIIVRVDKREKRHSYALDDGTGVIQCTFWKNSKHDSFQIQAQLPSSLQLKWNQLQTASRETNEEGFEIGDLILVRGSIKRFREQLEIDVLDHYKIQNPCLEYQRVLQFSSLYKVYNQPMRLPTALQTAIQREDKNAYSKEAIESAIAREIQGRYCSPALDPIFTASHVLSWSAVADLFSCRETIKEKPVDSTHEQISLIMSALQSLEKHRGWVIRLDKPCPEAIDRFEMISAHSPVSREVLKALRTACLYSHNNSKMGCHIMSLLDRMRASNGQDGTTRHNSLAKPVLVRALECLIINSDVIEVAAQRYIPME